MKLTQRYVDEVELPAERSELLVFDNDVPGFGLRVGRKRKSWVVQWQVGPAQRRMTIGHTGILSASKAREAARTILAKVRLGEDPQDVKLSQRRAARVGDLVPTFLHQKRLKGRAPRSIKEMERYLLDYAKPLHRSPIKAVDRGMVAQFLDRLTNERSPIVADACRRYLSSFFSWGMRNGHAELNPVMLTERPAGPSVRERLLSSDEIRNIWAATVDGSDFSAIVRLLMLTGQRRLEIAGLSWSEVDLDKDVLRLPSSRVKNKMPHLVHLSPPARELIRERVQHDGRENLFGDGPRPFSGFSKAKAALDRRIAALTGKHPEDWRLHDLRRYADTTMRELGTDPWVVEAILNHLPQGVSRHYNFAKLDDVRREALTRLGGHVIGVVGADVTSRSK
jgi:integrase